MLSRVQERHRADQRHRVGLRDATGHFISGLRKEDFLVYEDDRLVEVTHFSAERVPVSLGIALDTSGSMAGEKIQEAQSALDRFLYELLDKEDEIFLYRFSNYPVLLQGWTTDRQALARALGRIIPSGGTAMYDAIAEAIPLAAQGQHRKKAVLLISDGNDTTSLTSVLQLKKIIRESEVLVYAIGIDGEGQSLYRPAPTPPQPPRVPFRFRFRPAAAVAAGSRSSRAARAARAAGRGTTITSTSPRSAISPTTAAAARRSCAIRATSTLDREHRRRTEQAVLPRLSVQRKEGRPLARDPGGSATRHLPRASKARLHRQLNLSNRLNLLNPLSLLNR